LSEEGVEQIIPKEIKNNMKDNTTNVEHNLLLEYIDSDDKTHLKYLYINKNLELLKIPHENIQEYSDYILDSKKLINHLNIIRLLKSDEYIKIK
jgi:hypothetical protein